MRNPIRALVAALLLISGAAAFGQNLLATNPNHKKSLEFKRMAEQAFDAGEFQQAIQYAAQAEELSKIARAEAEVERQRFIAFNQLRRAEARYAYCEKEGAAERYPDAWSAAQPAMAAAQAAYKAKEYPASTEASKKVIELLAGVQPRPREAAKAPEPVKVEPVVAAPPPEPAAEPETVLPATYIVRLIPERRDCFWRIAEYPFVYGDPLKWPILYEANKDKIPQPDNPHLILPEMEVTIPSIDGEKREGVWTPEGK
jgi:hypothetical protein